MSIPVCLQNYQINWLLHALKEVSKLAYSIRVYSRSIQERISTGKVEKSFQNLGLLIETKETIICA